MSVIIPVFNEESVINDTIAQIHQTLGKSNIKRYEIIVVNDGSTDGTTEKLAGCNLEFRLVEHDQNKGYGASLKSGIRQCQYDTIAITDADGTYPINDIPRLFNEMVDGAWDMVVGARTGKHVKIPLVRRPAKWVLNKLANYLAEYDIPDLNSGFRIFKKAQVLQFLGILPRGFSFTTTVTLAMLTNDLQVKFIPIDYLKRKGKSKIRPIRDTLNFVQLIVRTVLYFNPLKIFVPISLLLFLLSAGVLVYSAFKLGQILDTTVSVLFVSALQMLSIGMIADIIDKKNKL